MIKYLIIPLLFFVQNISAQIQELSPYQKVLYTFDNIQVRPEYGKGEKEFDNFVRSNFKNSKTEKGTILRANFIVEMDGTISNVEIVKDDNFGSGAELKRILEMSPKWLSGEHEGFHVRGIVNYTFKL